MTENMLQNISAQAIYERGREAFKGSRVQLDKALAAAFELYDYWKDGTDAQKGEVETLPDYKASKKGEHYRHFPFIGVIFPEATRTSRGLYATVLRLAEDQGIEPDGLSTFIEERGGIAAIGKAARGEPEGKPTPNPKFDEAVKVDVTKLLCGVEGDRPLLLRALLERIGGDEGCYRLIHVRPETAQGAERFIKSPSASKRARKRNQSGLALQ